MSAGENIAAPGKRTTAEEVASAEWHPLNEGSDAECEFADVRDFTAYAFTSGAWKLFDANATDASLAAGTAADREAAKRACVEAMAAIDAGRAR